MATAAPRGPTLHQEPRLYRVPKREQTEESSCLKNFFCVTLRFRVLGYIIQQPPSFLFVASLLALAAVLPFIGVYIQNTQHLPDIDTMRVWNSFLGRLKKTSLCVTTESTNPVNVPDGESICVNIPFTVKMAKPFGNENYTLSGNLTGADLKTKISDSYTGKRIDKDVTVSILMEVPSGCSECSVNASVVIAAPFNATSVFGSFSQLFDSTQQPLPEYLCGDKLTAVSSPRSLYLAKGGDENCKKSTSYVWPVGEKYLHQGLIVVELSQLDRDKAAQRIKLSTIVVIGVVIAFVIGIGCTDRPAKPKPMQS